MRVLSAAAHEGGKSGVARCVGLLSEIHLHWIVTIRICI